MFVDIGDLLDNTRHELRQPSVIPLIESSDLPVRNWVTEEIMDSLVVRQVKQIMFTTRALEQDVERKNVRKGVLDDDPVLFHGTCLLNIRSVPCDSAYFTRPLKNGLKGGKKDYLLPNSTI